MSRSRMLVSLSVLFAACAAGCGAADADPAGAPAGQPQESELSDVKRAAFSEELLALKAAKLVSQLAQTVKVIKTGELTRKVALKGIGATAGAKAAIEAAGGTVA